MKLRHAAALASVGWYLMTPPTQALALEFDLPGYGLSIAVDRVAALVGRDDAEKVHAAL